MSAPQSPGGPRASIRAWLSALRPKTLPVGAASVLVGSALAKRHGPFDATLFGATLATALLLQITANLANDYYDHVKRVDQGNRVGPPRAAGRSLPATRVRDGMVVAMAAATGVGLYLVTVGGWPIVTLGTAALLAATAYAGGPRPLGHYGLGDLFVFIFFGPVAVAGTYFLQSHQLPVEALLAGVPMGTLGTAVLVVNNVRDIPTDGQVGKRTLAVRLGRRGSWGEYGLLLAAAYTVPFVLWLHLGLGPSVLLPLFSLPVAVAVWWACWCHPGGPGLTRLLVRTAGLQALYGALFAGGLLL